MNNVRREERGIFCPIIVDIQTASCESKYSDALLFFEEGNKAAWQFKYNTRIKIGLKHK